MHFSSLSLSLLPPPTCFLSPTFPFSPSFSILGSQDYSCNSTAKPVLKEIFVLCWNIFMLQHAQGWAFLGGSRITADGDCSHEIKRCFLLGRKAMTNLDSILKSRDITLPTKVCLVKAMVFPVVTYGCESWTIKEAECQRIDAFELWCWRRLLRVPWTARRSIQS